MGHRGDGVYAHWPRTPSPSPASARPCTTFVSTPASPQSCASSAISPPRPAAAHPSCRCHHQLRCQRSHPRLPPPPRRRNPRPRAPLRRSHPLHPVRDPALDPSCPAHLRHRPAQSQTHLPRRQRTAGDAAVGADGGRGRSCRGLAESGDAGWAAGLRPDKAGCSGWWGRGPSRGP